MLKIRIENYGWFNGLVCLKEITECYPTDKIIITCIQNKCNMCCIMYGNVHLGLFEGWVMLRCKMVACDI
jgi:hypothetical protein